MSNALLRQQVAIRDGWACRYCGVLLAHELEHWTLPDEQGARSPISGYMMPTLDHAVARSLGGGNHLDNLRLSCGPCNSKKGVRRL